MPSVATQPYIPAGTLSAYTDFSKYFQNQGANNIIRQAQVSNRRTSDTAPAALSQFNQEYGLGEAKQVGDMSMAGAGQAESEAMQFGGISPFSGNSLQGNLPWQSQQTGIENEFKKNLTEEGWANDQKIADAQAANSLWSGIFGGIGSLFGGSNLMKGLKI